CRPRFRAISKAKFANGIVTVTAFPKITESDGLPLGGFPQGFDKKVARPIRNDHQTFPMIPLLYLLVCLFGFDDLDVILGGEIPQRLGIVVLFVLHDEPNGITTHAAAEAFEYSPTDRHIERGRFLVVKRT